jgi:hypothetical protein
MFINYVCKCSHSMRKFFKKTTDISKVLECPKCHKDMERTLSSPTSKSTQIIDNGCYERQVEVMNEIVEEERERVKCSN